MNSAMARIREQEGKFQTIPNGMIQDSDQKPILDRTHSNAIVNNPFRTRHPSASAVSNNANNYDGGLLYGVSERDNWLLAKDDGAPDEVHQSHPMWKMIDLTEALNLWLLHFNKHILRFFTVIIHFLISFKCII